ncbi:MAG TPA: DUF1552 domain-containing protein, partial [Candidatus Limnocylindrales bacterium]
MESLPAFAQPVKGSAGATKPPVRLGIIYFSNGVEPAHWWAKGSGADMELGPGLEPMLPHREDMVFIRGLFNQSAQVSTSPHLGRMNLLSGAPVSLDPNQIRVGTSMDQVLATAFADETEVPSLVLGIEPNELRLEDGLSMIYGSSLSWISPTRAAAKEIYPARTFDRLVDDGSGRTLDRSILDAVWDESQGLRPRISKDDDHKLSEYFEGIRDIEKRIERASTEERLEGWRPTLAQPDMPRPKHELPQDVPAHMKLMLDLIVLAFQMDKTRVATLMLNNDLSQMNFKFLDGVQGALHLDLTHNGRAADKEAMYLKTNQFHIEQFAYLTQRMKDIAEGETTLLDNSILMMASNLFDGDLHSANQLPVLLTGKGGGSLATGRILDYLDKGDEHRKACSLHLSLMDRMGVRLDRFGDSTT